MRASAPIHTDIVLVGGGHAHVDVLKRFGMRPEPGVRLTLISREVMTPYSGMLPGQLAGHYSFRESHIDLRPLCRFAGARLYHDAAIGIDLDARRVLLASRPDVPFDLLSLDIGSTPARSGLPCADTHAVPIKPVSDFLERLEEIERGFAGADALFRIVVVGAGAGGVELAMSLKYRLTRERDGMDLAMTVLTDRPEPLHQHAAGVRRRLIAHLARHGIELRVSSPVAGFEAGWVRLASGERLPADVAILVTHAGAAGWLQGTGLALDPNGFVQVDDTLRSPSHRNVFAAGDVAAMTSHRLHKAGVFAVRQGPYLAENLRRAARGERLRPYRPQRRTLALISTGDPYAVASYGPVSVEGSWVWRWKDWIDRRWMRKYQELPEMAADPDAPMRCGGCGAKVPAEVLRAALATLPKASRKDVLVGLDAPDDAAVTAPPHGRVLVQTVDQFRAFVDDPYLFGRIAANHCLGDLYAMNAEPATALAAVTLPFDREDKVAADLEAVLRGAGEVLAEAGAEIVGGHTGEGAELTLGLTVTGYGEPDRLWRKAGLRDGDALLLTKPLGTGALFAADMRGKARSAWIEAALETMQQSNGPAARYLAGLPVSACTDVTGFGLAGHLLELLEASDKAAVIDRAAIPLLDGVREVLARGIASSLHPANARAARAMSGAEAVATDPLFDPQTAGGLLVALPGDTAETALAALRSAGYGRAAIIGRVERAQPGQRRLRIEDRPG